MKNNLTKVPDISVIVCCYNHEKWIERCLRSLLLQEYIKNFDYEVIIIDDFSKDNSLKVIKNFQYENIKIFKNKRNLGLPKSINKAIRLAKGRYIVRVDSDDYVSRNFLYMCRVFLNLNREFQAVAVDYYKVKDSEELIKKTDCFKEQIACGVMFRKECLFEIGLYNDKFQMREGHDLRKRFEKKFQVGHLNIPLYKYRFHEKNRTKNKKKLTKYNQLLKKKK
jgi:glycosyltransferase involved in cell wall biosynthesis|tara:strand:+ start:443 stop:1111 length:669 start_codon:yes stop_codon:yes gene_type:complete